MNVSDHLKSNFVLIVGGLSILNKNLRTMILQSIAMAHFLPFH